MAKISLVILVSIISTLPARGDEPENSVRITPTEFFSGELARLKPHVGFKAVCFKIARKGSWTCAPVFEFWKDGEKVFYPGYAFDSNEQSDEITMSWRETPAKKKGDRRYYFQTGGIRTFGIDFDVPETPGSEARSFTIKKSVVLNSQNESPAVWAIHVGGEGDLSSKESVSKLQRTSRWVIIMRIIARE